MGGALHPVRLCSVALTTQILSLGKIRSVKQHHFIYHTVWFPSSLITYFLFGLCVKCTVVGLRLPLSFAKRLCSRVFLCSVGIKYIPLYIFHLEAILQVSLQLNIPVPYLTDIYLFS